MCFKAAFDTDDEINVLADRSGAVLSGNVHEVDLLDGLFQVFK